MARDIEWTKLYIQEHLPEIRSLKILAVRIDINAETLRKRFFRETGSNISEYIAHAKVSKMKSLLTNSDLACKVICLNLGFREDSGAKLFKRIVGVTMERYRRLNSRQLHVQ
jgi:transcriptional regulator GlxA family with amidase domain